MGLEILCQPHVPKPLHGLNPRIILGKEWWDKVRKEAQRLNNYKCFACGIHKSQAKLHKWLEGHEIWKIDYNTGECKVIGIASLCHYCHNFIHSGRLSCLIENREIEVELAQDILQYGFDLLKNKNLKVFEFTYLLAKELIVVDTYDVDYYTVYDNCEWSDYHLILNGKRYESNFETYEEWFNYYN